MWMFIMLAFSVGALVGVVYLVTRVHRFSPFRRLGETHPVLAWLASVPPVALLGLFWLINVYTVAVVIVHVLAIWLLCDLGAYLYRKIRKRPRGTRYFAGVTAVAVSVAYLSVGWFCAHHVFETTYAFTTEKDLDGETLRVALLSDSHLGITLDGEEFAAQMKRIEEAKPDVVVVCGDFVDDDSPKADMVRACEALGEMETTYGVYYVYGNHDKGYYRYRDFSAQDLRAELERNGITILEDESVPVGERFYLIGRQDRSTPNRAGVDELLAGLDRSKYAILLDHQPNDYANEATEGVDLVLSGHTHGGHLFPGGLLGVWTGQNDRTYGTEVRGSTRFLVTSGISGWAIPFKTGTYSEYVLIDILQG